MASDSSSSQETDVIVIGGGPTGENAAARAVRGGLSAVLVESDLLGGECSYWACMPSKALLRPGQALAAVKRLPGAAAAVTGPLDVQAVLARRDEFTSHWRDDGQLEWAQGAGIDVVRGHGRLAGERLVDVEQPDGSTVRYRARQAVVLATGSRAVTPPIEGLRHTEHWGSREATAARAVPERLAVLGGGVVGCEMAQAFARLGSRVTMLVKGGVLGRMEAKAGDLVTEGLRDDGVDVRLGVGLTKVERPGRRRATPAEVHLTLDSGDVLVADELLVATGRRPATSEVGLETVGLDGEKPLDVDTTGRVVSVDGGWLYAAGDVTGAAPLTHMGKYAARAVGDVIAARAKGPANSQEPPPWHPHGTSALRQAITQVVFTDPEVASVGLTEQQARDSGLHIRTVDTDIAVAGSSLHATATPAGLASSWTTTGP